MHIKLGNMSVWTLQRVKHILNLKNLFSTGQPDDSGHIVTSLKKHGRSTRIRWSWHVVRELKLCI